MKYKILFFRLIGFIAVLGGFLFVAQIIPWMLDNFKLYGTFWFFALCSVPALYFAIRILPETKGKTLEEIEKMW